jgi:uncharacterized protein YfaS (alpha-2-macroglobulin family)
MLNDRASALALAAVLSLAVVSVSSQSVQLSIASAGPRGELAQLADAVDIRIVFSEPMIALGAAPSDSAPSWIHITPAIPGSFYWSGTKTLIFSPDAARPLPYATTFTVRVDASATSVSGRALGTPYRFAFTTPTVRLLSAQWYRRDERFDRPAVIVLHFNQRVRTEDVVAHGRVALEPHAWTAPALSAKARDLLQRTDPAGLGRFDAKVAAVRRVTSGSSSIGIRAAESWNEERFPAKPEQVVIETATAPPPDAWLRITLDANMPSPDGPQTRGPQSTTVTLEPTFFVKRTQCATPLPPGSFRWSPARARAWRASHDLQCIPEGNDPIGLTRPVATAAFASALTITDVTDPAVERAVTAARGIDADTASRPTDDPTVASAGFPFQVPLSTWRLRLGPELQAADGQTLDYPWVGFVEAMHAVPFVGLEGAVWEASGGPQIPIYARNVQSVRQRLASVTPSTIVARLRELQERARPPVTEGTLWPLSMTPDVVQGHGLDLSALLSPSGTGLVWADLAAEKILPRFTPPPYGEFEPPRPGQTQARPRSLLQITNLGVSVKDSPQSSLVFVTRLDTGEPVPDARVTIVDERNQTLWRGATDRDGVALAPALPLRVQRGDRESTFVVTAEKDGDVAFVGSDWTAADRDEWRFTYGRRESSAVLRGKVFTDRGVYKEREEVHIKAVLRDDTPSGMRAIPMDAALEVVMRDGRNQEIDRRRIAVNRWSSAEWTWRVPVDAALGGYRIEVSRAGAASGDANEPEVVGSFRVAAFRRPDFRVDAELTADQAILGSTLRGSIGAAYLFGGALGGRPVRWVVSRLPTLSVPDAVRERYPEARYSVGYLPDQKEWFHHASHREETGVLDAGGHATVPVSTAAEPDLAYSYTFEADVEGASGQRIANRAALVVHPASLYIAVSRPPMFVDTKTGAHVGIVAADLSGRAVAGVAVTVSLFREKWISQPGKYSWQPVDWIRREIPAGEWTMRTGAGETPMPIPVPESGSYVLRAIGRDAAGRQTRTELTFYALGPGLSSWRSEGTHIDLVPERKTWKPGETARILIQSPWPRATALVTVEREGIRSHRRFAITSTQDTVDVPITEADVPNVYVSVLLVKGRTSTELAADGSDQGQPAFRVGHTELTVDDASKRLSVKVSADRDEYRPRQPVTVSVAVAEPDGRPASSEVTLWAVDYGVLSLTGYSTPDLLKAIYVPKSLQVTTEDNRVRLMSRRRLLVPIEGEGGVPGGVVGGIVGEMPGFAYDAVAVSAAPVAADSVDDEVRSDFRPIVFWLGSATTDTDGRASATVTLPDSLTTYRIMAVAGTGASHFGFGEREIRVTKPLTLLTAFPRFLAKGDRASFGAVVTNGGKDTGTAVITVQSLDPGTLQFSAAHQEVRLAPGASQSITFDALATAAGEARVRIDARLGGETDALEMPLTIGRQVRTETRAAYGETAGTAIERLALPPGVLPGVGGLTLELASTALVGLGESARYLDQYPYPCAEQKASRVLALLLASDLGGAFSLPGIKPGEYRASAETALRELYSYQCDGSGGFALWAGQCGNESAYLTAYVLHVMKTGQNLQVTLNANAVDQALSFLERELNRPPPDARWWPVWAASQAYSVKVLAEFGRKPRASINQLAGMADRLPIFALSYLADALVASNDKGPRYQDVIRRLTNALKIEADRAHVEEKDDDALAWLWNTNVRATAVVLDGLSRRKDALAPAAPLARWLIAARTNGRWGTTHENAMALEALVAYYRAFEKDVPRMTAAVTLGTAPVGTATFNGRSTVAQQIQVSMPDLQAHMTDAAPAALSISRSGTGRVHYTARLQYLVPDPPDAVDRGFRVERRYEPYVKDGSGVATTSFTAGDLIRVTVALTIRGEGRYLALTDPLPAGLEPLDDWSLTTASALARAATRTGRDDDWRSLWRGGYFDHVEKHDDRVVAFATRLGSGRHEFSYLVRAATAGTFDAPGATVEAMYAPELGGRSQAAILSIK